VSTNTAALALTSVNHLLVGVPLSAMLSVFKVTGPVCPFTDETASVLSTFFQADPIEINQSPTSSVIPANVPATVVM